MKKNKNLNFMVYPHIFLLLWAVLFSLSLLLNNGKIVSMLAVGNFTFLFLNIPFSVLSFVLNAKGFFTRKHSVAIIVLSILNIIVSMAAWYFLVSF